MREDKPIQRQNKERGGSTIAFVFLIALIALMGSPAVVTSGLRIADLLCDDAIQVKHARGFVKGKVKRISGVRKGDNGAISYRGYYDPVRDTCCAAMPGQGVGIGASACTSLKAQRRR